MQRVFRQRLNSKGAIGIAGLILGILIILFILWWIWVYGSRVLADIRMATPADNLYGIKRAMEETDYALRASPVDRFYTSLDLANERVREIESMAPMTISLQTSSDPTVTTDSGSSGGTGSGNGPGNQNGGGSSPTPLPSTTNNTNSTQLSRSFLSTGTVLDDLGTEMVSPNLGLDGLISPQMSRMISPEIAELKVIDTANLYQEELGRAIEQLAEIPPDSEVYTRMLSDLSKASLVNVNKLEVISAKNINPNLKTDLEDAVRISGLVTKNSLVALPDIERNQVLSNLQTELPEINPQLTAIIQNLRADGINIEDNTGRIFDDISVSGFTGNTTRILENVSVTGAEIKDNTAKLENKLNQEISKIGGDLNLPLSVGQTGPISLSNIDLSKPSELPIKIDITPAKPHSSTKPELKIDTPLLDVGLSKKGLDLSK